MADDVCFMLLPLRVDSWYIAFDLCIWP